MFVGSNILPCSFFRGRVELNIAMRETTKSSELTSKLNRIKHLNAIKLNDSIGVGYSDIHACYRGMAIYIETKITNKLTGDLKHPFSPQQKGFLLDMADVGALAVGMVYVRDAKKWYYLEPSDITENGQIKKMTEVGDLGNFITENFKRLFDYPNGPNFTEPVEFPNRMGRDLPGKRKETTT